jgi:hypothetical protein
MEPAVLALVATTLAAAWVNGAFLDAPRLVLVSA